MGRNVMTATSGAVAIYAVFSGRSAHAASNIPQTNHSLPA